MRSIICLLLTIPALTGKATETPRVAMATEAREPAPASHAARGFIGIGVLTLPRFQGADEHLVLPFLVGRLDYANMSAEIRGQGARFDLLPVAGLALGPTVNVRLPRTSAATDAAIARLPEIGRAVELGVFVSKSFVGAHGMMGLTVDLEGRLDVSGTYDGATLTLGAGAYRVLGGGFVASIDASMTYYDANYARTYFSVSSAAAAASGLSVYTAGAGLSEASVGATLSCDVAQHWRLLVRGQASNLLGDAKSSPIIDDHGAALGVLVGAASAWTF